jgi:2-polyprenyl-3-methyl-5-hydroxy-6-metoxy-1,4-benzoquinol methylase
MRAPYEAEFIQDDAHKPSPDRDREFDLILFLGVLHHLLNPILVLATIREITRGRVDPGSPYDR